jgi:hypothetical protein
MDFLFWLEQSSLSIWMRESSSLWAYPFVLFLHTLGLGMVAGIIIAADLAVLTFPTQISLVPLRKLSLLVWLGFFISASSGTALLIADATTKLTSPIFYIKMFFIALALGNFWILEKQILSNVDKGANSKGKFLALSSIFLWVAVITAGRWMAYLDPTK